MGVERIYRVACDRCTDPVPPSYGVAVTPDDARHIATRAGYESWPKIQPRRKMTREWVCPACVAKVNAYNAERRAKESAT